MEFSVARNKNLRFGKIHPLLCDFVRTIPDVIDPDHLTPDAEARIYPEATSDPELDSVRAEWKAYVEPDLQEHFRSAREVVIADLKQITEKRGGLELQIAPGHAEAWLNALNQARLALAADLGFEEEALASTDTPDLTTERGTQIFRLNLFAFMQQCLIDKMD